MEPRSVFPWNVAVLLPYVFQYCALEAVHPTPLRDELPLRGPLISRLAAVIVQS